MHRLFLFISQASCKLFQVRSEDPSEEEEEEEEVNSKIRDNAEQQIPI